MSLADRLAATKKAFLSKVPPEVAELVARTTRELAESGILDGVPKVGDPLPAFELSTPGGETYRSAELLAKGPLVLTFYRGVW